MMQAVILGCGSSGGVPRIGGHWGDCDPTNPKNRRRRCSLLLRRQGPAGITTALIDTGPDFVPQMLDAGVSTLDGVVWTHPHADHIHGIDDLRQVAINARREVAGWADRDTAEALRRRFGYVFATPPGSAYPAVVALNIIDGPVVIDGSGGTITLTPIPVRHGRIIALGFRIDGVAGALIYLPDVNAIPETSWPLIEGAEVFICDALRREEHPSHANLDMALGYIARAKPQRAVLTNMHIDLDYATLAAELPPGIEPAFDGMTITFGG